MSKKHSKHNMLSVSSSTTWALSEYPLQVER